MSKGLIPGFGSIFLRLSNLLGTLEGVVVARNVRHDCTLIRLGGVDHIYFIGIREMIVFFLFLETEKPVVPYLSTYCWRFKLFDYILGKLKKIPVFCFFSQFRSLPIY